MKAGLIHPSWKPSLSKLFGHWFVVYNSIINLGVRVRVAFFHAKRPIQHYGLGSSHWIRNQVARSLCESRINSP